MKNAMNNIKMSAVKGLFFLFALLLVLPACNERLNEMNQNPNALTTIPDDFLFATLVRNTFRNNIGRWQQDYGAQYAHQAVSSTWTKGIDQYFDVSMQGDVPEEIFSGTYRDCIKYSNDIINTNSKEGNVNEVRIAMTEILAIVNFAKLTDYFGDIPYFEAGKGKDEIYLPKYDPQKEIYTDMVEQLKVQMAKLEGANPADGYPGQDPMYNNNLEKWVRFANSFRLRLAMRARFVDPGKYNPIIVECLGKPLIETNNQNAALQHWDSENGELYNPWYDLKVNYSAGTYQYNVSEMFVNWLQTTNDPRLMALVKPTSSGTYAGIPNGLTDVALGNYTRSRYSVPGDLMLAPDQYLYIMTASEIWFLRAEAALFNIGSGGNPAELYQQGIVTGMEQWGVTSQNIDNYLVNVQEATLNGTQENQLRQIATQMWVAFVPNHQEAWNNIKRTGYPIIPQRNNPLLSKGVTDGYLPKRLKYPYTVEKTLNGANMQVAIDRMGGNKIDTPVWWDVRD
jgi:hypothetical protein